MSDNQKQELRETAARVLVDLHDVPFRDAMEAIEDIVRGDCYTATVAAMGWDPLAGVENRA